MPRWRQQPRSTTAHEQGWSLALEAAFSAVYFVMGFVVKFALFATGITPLGMLYRKMVTFGGGVQEEREELFP